MGEKLGEESSGGGNTAADGAESAEGEGHRPTHVSDIPDGYVPNKTCMVGRTVLLPARRVLAEVVDMAGTNGTVRQVSRVAALGPKGAKAAAEAAVNMGVSLVDFSPVGSPLEGPPAGPGTPPTSEGGEQPPAA